MNQPTIWILIPSNGWPIFSKTLRKPFFLSPMTVISWIIFQLEFLNWIVLVWLNTKETTRIMSAWKLSRTSEMQPSFTRSSNSISRNWPGCVGNRRRVQLSNRRGSIASKTSRRTYLTRLQKQIWKCPLKPVGSVRKSLNFKMLILPMTKARFYSSLISWFKIRIGSELWEIMGLGNRPSSISLPVNSNRLLGRLLSEKRWELLTSRSRSKVWMKASGWSTSCKK